MAAPLDLEVYKDALLVLATAGVVVPVMHRFRISPVLGFLIAGAILSPKGLGALSAQPVVFNGGGGWRLEISHVGLGGA